MIDANIEGYRAIRNAGHDILPKADADFESEKYRKTCLRFFKLMCATSLGKLCASDHAMNAIDEMSALNRDIKRFFDENGAAYPVWQALEAEAGRYSTMKYAGMPFGMWTLFAAVLPKPADSGVRLRYRIRQKPSRKKQSRNTGRSSPSCLNLKRATGSR